MVAGCGTGSGEQADKKEASTGPETAKFEMSKPGKIGVSMMNADGSGLTAIHGELATATSLDWQPVGRQRSR